MTEAAHQMASNPLPPGVRKPGSVGPAAGPQVAIMSESGEILPSGKEGEIVISGPNVMDGYAANPAANAEAFEDGWFRTGDLGWIDDDGYVTISGRKKEIINRGGETISPREIDEALLDHPSVMQVLAFAVPDRRLGEQVAAAVVVDPAAGEVSEHDIRRFAQLQTVGCEGASPNRLPRRDSQRTNRETATYRPCGTARDLGTRRDRYPATVHAAHAPQLRFCSLICGSGFSVWMRRRSMIGSWMSAVIRCLRPA